MNSSGYEIDSRFDASRPGSPTFVFEGQSNQQPVRSACVLIRVK